MKGGFWEESSCILQGQSKGESNKPAFKSCQPGCCCSTSLFFKILILKLDLETDSIHLPSSPDYRINLHTHTHIHCSFSFKTGSKALLDKGAKLSNDQSTTVFLICSYLIMCGILKKPRHLKVAVAEV